MACWGCWHSPITVFPLGACKGKCFLHYIFRNYNFILHFLSLKCAHLIQAPPNGITHCMTKGSSQAAAELRHWRLIHGGCLQSSSWPRTHLACLHDMAKADRATCTACAGRLLKARVQPNPCLQYWQCKPKAELRPSNSTEVNEV